MLPVFVNQVPISVFGFQKHNNISRSTYSNYCQAIVVIFKKLQSHTSTHSECYFSCCYRSQGASELRGNIATLMTSFPDLPLRSYFSLEVIPSEHSASEHWTCSSFQDTVWFQKSLHICLLGFFFSCYSCIRTNIQHFLARLWVSGWLKITACALLMFHHPTCSKHLNAITDTHTQECHGLVFCGWGWHE